MKLHALMIGAAALALGTAAFAQDNPASPAPGAQPVPTMQPATPMPPPATAQPSTPPASEPSTTTPPSQPDTSPAKPADESMSKPSYGTGWDARKCAAAEKKGKADPASCPKPEPKG